MRKVVLLLVAALLISIPAFAIGNPQVAVSPTVVAAGPVETAVDETVAAEEVTADEAIAEAAVEEATTDEAVDVPEQAPMAETPAPAPAAQPVAAPPTAIAAPKVQETPATVPAVTEAPAPVASEPVVPQAQETPVAVQAPSPVVVTPDMPLIDESKANLGLAVINYAGTAKARLEVRKGDVKYYYNIYPGQEYFPLQMGNGQYTVTVFENTTDNRYRATGRSVIDVAMADPDSVFLSSIQEIKWTESSLAVSRAQQITSGLTTDRQKFEAVYRFVVNNVDYDTPKLATLTSTYLPNLDETLTSGKGICYDHASLMAAMLRSLGIPTKLVKGYATTVQGYHAWNEVYVDGEWLIVDTSVDAQRRARGAQITMLKSANVYSKTLEF